MKKDRIVFILVLVSILILIVSFLRKRNITELYSNEVDDISKIFLQDGLTGNITELTEREDLQEVVEFLASLRLRKGIYIPGFGGWLYRVIIYCNNGEKVYLSFQRNRIQMNTKVYYYDTDKNMMIDDKLYQ